ncbi:uncharacterized protein [Aegilops tauschii subsp. strangulata]|uniref:Uncharacterized protein n=4 Tax=Triticinae TaxID=1648030 RepID=A0A452YLY5_AEGTS|nr:uncharacterized protein LOC109732819 [Aegilops tauschii subsp. strangulata]XP_044449500.1 uncharacterized protein LOC123181306 [Triticum aestivum]
MHLAMRPAGKTTAATAHARSASLPHEHPHPIMAHLDDSIRTLRSWSARATGGQSSGIALVDAVLAALGELLALPQAVAALHTATAACDQILERILVLADAYGTFLSALVTLKQSVAEQQVGTRRGDGMMVAASLRVHRRTEKELCRLVTMMRHAARGTLRPLDTTNNEVIGIVADVAVATVEASETIFMECAAMSPDMQVPSNKWLARLSVRPSAKKAAPETAMVALERLEKLEESIGGLETGSEKVFRRLLQSRVSLLNILTPF